MRVISAIFIAISVMLNFCSCSHAESKLAVAIHELAVADDAKAAVIVEKRRIVRDAVIKEVLIGDDEKELLQ